MDMVEKYEISYGWSDAEKKESERLYMEHIKNMQLTKLAELSASVFHYDTLTNAMITPLTIEDIRKMSTVTSQICGSGGAGGFAQVFNGNSNYCSGYASGYIPNVTAIGSNANVNISLSSTGTGTVSLGSTEDIYFTQGVNPGRGSLVDKLPGGDDLGMLDEVKYFTTIKSGLGLTVKLPDIVEEKKPAKIDYLAAVRDIVGGV